MKKIRFPLTILLLVTPRIGKAQSEQKASFDSLQLQRVELYQSYHATPKGLTVETGKKEQCAFTHRLLMQSLLLAATNRIDSRKLNADYHLTLLSAYTNTMFSRNFNTVDVYVLSSFSTKHKQLADFIRSLKNNDYISVDPPMAMPHTCYIFRIDDQLVMAFVPLFMSDAESGNEKIVTIAKEAVEQYAKSHCSPTIQPSDTRLAVPYEIFQYDNGDDYFQEGLRRIVDAHHRIGYVDARGRVVIKPRFAFGFPFKNGRAKVTDVGKMREVEGSNGESHYWKSDQWYYINKQGQKVDIRTARTDISQRGCK